MTIRIPELCPICPDTPGYPSFMRSFCDIYDMDSRNCCDTRTVAPMFAAEVTSTE